VPAAGAGPTDWELGVKANLKIMNPNKVPCTVNFAIKPRGSYPAGVAFPISVQPTAITIPPLEYRYATACFCPRAIQVGGALGCGGLGEGGVHVFGPRAIQGGGGGRRGRGWGDARAAASTASRRTLTSCCPCWHAPQAYSGTFEASVEAGTDPRTRIFTCEVRGEGMLPTLTLQASAPHHRAARLCPQQGKSYRPAGGGGGLG